MSRYATAMLPPFQPSGELPPGIYWATWDEVADRFGWTEHRRRLCDGLRRGMESLRAAGCQTVYIDGSFVTATETPHDFDACWDLQGVDAARLDPMLLIFDNLRAAQKLKYLGEFFPAQSAVDSKGTIFLEYFQVTKRTGGAKGIVAVDLRGLA